MRPVLARSEDLNSLKQIVDTKARKLKPKFSDDKPYVGVIQKEQQRVIQENFYLSKASSFRLDDKLLIK